MVSSTKQDEPDDIDRRYEAFLRKLSPENRRKWNEAVVLFAEKFGADLEAEGLRAGIELLDGDSTRPLGNHKDG